MRWRRVRKAKWKEQLVVICVVNVASPEKCNQVNYCKMWHFANSVFCYFSLPNGFSCLVLELLRVDGILLRRLKEIRKIVASVTWPADPQVEIAERSWILPIGLKFWRCFPCFLVRRIEWNYFWSDRRVFVVPKPDSSNDSADDWKGWILNLRQPKNTCEVLGIDVKSILWELTSLERRQKIWRPGRPTEWLSLSSLST